jgi:Phosphotransferase enzyme family
MEGDPIHPETIHQLLQSSLGLSCTRLEPLSGGRNSRVYRAECGTGRSVVVKEYFHSPADPRDRLGTEWKAFLFLRKNGVSCVPAPLAFDAQHRLAAYEYVEGRSLDLKAISTTDLHQASAFLAKLHAIAMTTPPDTFGPASEACFSIEAIFENIDHRIEILKESATSAPELAQFLERDLLPFRWKMQEWCQTLAKQSGICFSTPLVVASRTLSPSDFGFHNALKKTCGTLVFLDFEYFGWDDPAKTIADFVLHPAMSLGTPLRKVFVGSALNTFSEIPHLAERTKLVFPLFGIKWCCILLNEFTRQHAHRRQFSSRELKVAEQKKHSQLAKAQSMLMTLKDANLRFP